MFLKNSKISVRKEDMENGVIHLELSDLVGKRVNPALLGGKSGLLVVYADWCGHCKKLKPLWEKLNMQDNQVVYLAVNESHEKNLVSTMKVSGFPTIFMISPSGNLSPYSGGRDEASLKKGARGGK
jgi:thiol-disulfide isomerase/thioredoxin